jgi:hypothetical protein
MDSFRNIPAPPSEFWKDAVATASALPSLNNNIGDTRQALDTNIIYAWNGTAWISVASPGGSPTAVDGLTGDVLASGPGVVPATLKTVNLNTGSFGTVTSVPTINVNGKGLITSASNTSIQLPQSQVTNLVSSLASKYNNPTGTTSQYIRGDGTFDTFPTLNFAQTFYVAKNGNDATGNGSLQKPYLTVAAAMTAISDASPTKRYVIKVLAGDYTEVSVSLKANVFVIGESRESTKITGAVSLNANFTGSADHRSGFGQITLISACDFNWTTVTSGAGKLYFNEVSFNSTLNLYGYNSSIAQCFFDTCLVFGNMTISGINVGVYTNNVNFGNVTLTQHPTAGMATILAATGGYCGGSVSLTASVNNFARRCALFARSYWMNAISINGPSAYADVTDSSIPSAGVTISNGANLVRINQGNANTNLSNLTAPTAVNTIIMPAATNATNFGDWGKQWFWNFGYVHASTGTDLFLISYPSAFAPDTAGKNIGIYADGAGLQANANGGNIDIVTAAVSGTGIRGKVTIDAREVDVSSVKIVNVANGTSANDAVNLSQLNSNGNTVSRPISPLAGQQYFDTTINKPIWYNGTNWVDATGTIA